MGPDMEVNDGIPYVSGQVVSNPGNVSRMRRRFNELLDDAFSLFGSQKSDSINGADGETSTSPTLPLPPSGFRYYIFNFYIDALVVTVMQDLYQNFFMGGFDSKGSYY